MIGSCRLLVCGRRMSGDEAAQAPRRDRSAGRARELDVSLSDLFLGLLGMVSTLQPTACPEGVSDLLLKGYQGEPFRTMSPCALEASVSVPTTWRARHDRC
jgi:hypothetical protein